MNPPAQTGAPPKKKGQRGHHAVTARRLRPRAHGRHRRPRLRRPGGRWTTRVARADGRGRAARAAAASRTARSPRTSSRARSPSASGSTTSTSRSTASTPTPPSSSRPPRPSATRPCPVSFAGERTLLVAMADPANVLAHRRHRGHDRLRGAPGGRLAGRHRAAARAPRGPRLRQRRRRRRSRTTARSPSRSGPSRRRRPGRCTTSASRPRSTSAPRGEDASVIQLVHRVIKEAVERGASDIHFEPGDEDMRVRYRIDGVLQEAAVDPRPAPCPPSSRA